MATENEFSSFFFVSLDAETECIPVMCLWKFHKRMISNAFSFVGHKNIELLVRAVKIFCRVRFFLYFCK